MHRSAFAPSLLRGVALALALCASLCGCASLHDLFTFSLQGDITLRNAAGETLRLTPDDCTPGYQRAFNGYDLYSTRQPDWHVRAVAGVLDDTVVRIVTRVDGKIQKEDLHKSDCAQLDVHTQQTGLTVNDIVAISGTVDLNCVSPAGTQVEGHLRIRNCDTRDLPESSHALLRH